MKDTDLFSSEYGFADVHDVITLSLLTEAVRPSMLGKLCRTL